MPKSLYCCFIIFLCWASYAQKEANIWYFGQNAGLDFNNGVPAPLLDGQLNTNEGVASIADHEGNLLFYTDGITVYNKDHEPMENGNGLMGDSSSSQSAVIVPKPLSGHMYYIFTVHNEGGPNGFRYSEVDMQMDGGLGAVTANKNIPLLPQSTEQVTAILHENGTDIWVLTHGYANNVFYTFLVTAGGVNEVPVTSNAGISLNSIVNDAVGCMKASPDGTRIGACNHFSGAQLLDFNNSTGIVSNGIVLTNSSSMYGVEFSPSGKVLYTTNEFTARITQYDLMAANIPASATVVLNTDPLGTGGSLQLGPDGKIYKAAGGQPYLSVIHNPDVVGTGCNAESGGLNLGGPLSNHGLPNFIQSYFNYGIRVKNLCYGDITEFTVISGIAPQAVFWEFGDGSTSGETEAEYTYASSGTYTVRATVTINGNANVLEKQITITPLPLANTPDDLVTCDDESNDGRETFNLAEHEDVILGGQSLNDHTVTYHLSLTDAETGINPLSVNYINTVSPQSIYVRITSNASGCFATTSFMLRVLPSPVIDMPDEYWACEGENVYLTAPEGFDSYLWSTGETTRSILAGTGSYTIRVFKNYGDIVCSSLKNITVTGSAPAEITEIAIHDWTDNNNTITVIAEGTGDYEYSLDGVTYRDSPVFNNLPIGIYIVYVRDKNGCGVVTEEAVLLMYPKFFTPNGDGINEWWNVKLAYFEPGMKIFILDRYGKLITSFHGSDPGWNGTYNGNNLPSTDYWFIVKRSNGKEHKGHFSLMR